MFQTIVTSNNLKHYGSALVARTAPFQLFFPADPFFEARAAPHFLQNTASL